jgi:hypothetical protein
MSTDKLNNAIDIIRKMTEKELYHIIGNLPNLNMEKWDHLLPNDIKIRSYADACLDLDGAKKVATQINLSE